MLAKSAKALLFVTGTSELKLAISTPEQFVWFGSSAVYFISTSNALVSSLEILATGLLLLREFPLLFT